MNNSVMFIEGSRLGILEQNIRTMVTAEFGKRARQREFARVAKLLKDLRLLDKASQIVGLSYGSQADGTLGLFVCMEVEIKVQGASIPREGEEDLLRPTS